jgi:D-alanyl-lipoteichoic acid acyltransferase DltB (MBOAT superfamily)
VGNIVKVSTLDLILPVGISFYTFQTLSYVVDVYRGDVNVENNLGIYAAYISFFPQLVAGPIERARNLLPQIKGQKKFNYEQATYGLKLIAWGLFKKMLIADMLSPYVDKVFSEVGSYEGLSLVVASVFFSIQIYCDFSGYSDMAVGIAKLFGIDIMFNFRAPYFAKSVREFWSRWHISLSTWFRDYVYIPLGGNRCTKLRNSFNLMITFLVSGLWHGANWTFIVWGGIHGVAQIIEKRFVKKKYGIIGNMFVFALVVVAFVFFRAETISDALYVITHYFDGIFDPVGYIREGYITLGITAVNFIKLAIPLVMLVIYDYASLKTDVICAINGKNVIVRWIIYVAFVLMIMFYIQYFMGNGNVAQKFIYFDF